MNNEYYNAFLEYLQTLNSSDPLVLELVEQAYKAGYLAGYERIKKTCWDEQNQK